MIENNLLEIPVFKFAVDDISYLPRKAHATDTGWDVKAAETIELKPWEYTKISLGFRMFAPEGFWLELRPRSSTFIKKNLNCLYGVVDTGFEGKMMLCCSFQPTPDFISYNDTLLIKAGEAIGQLIPVRRQEMKVEMVSNEEYESLCQKRNSTRGEGGFGSSSS